MNKTCDCPLCKFNNPRPTNAAVIIKDQKLLVGKRVKEPFKGEWDFPGGYVEAGESVEASLKREVKEELGVNCKTTLLGAFPGNASYQKVSYPVLNFAYLTELLGKPILNKEENSTLAWVPLKEIDDIAYDSGKKILKFIKEKFTFDLKRVKELTRQLDPSAVINEQSLYKAMLGGYVSQVKEKGKLIGMGWVYPRQTMLRKQAVVEDMIVDEVYRGKGLGEKILQDLIDWCRKNGVEVLELTTNPKRIAANALYKKVGFWLHPTNHYLLNLKK